MARTPLIAFVVVTLLLALAPALALAAPPANDDFANRTVIPSLPYTDTLDMTEATADPTARSTAAVRMSPPSGTSSLPRPTCSSPRPPMGATSSPGSTSSSATRRTRPTSAS